MSSPLILPSSPQRRPCVPAGVRLLAIVLVLVLLPASCANRSRPPDIFVLLVDTLRADRLGAYGNQQGLTPFLDSLAQHGFVFRNTYAQSSWTDPSVASLLTSRYQSQHGITSFLAVLGDDEITLPEVLHQRGYATGAFIANFLLRRDLGYAQGFDYYRTYSHSSKDAQGKRTYVKARAEEIDREALSWLDQVHRDRPGAPVFVYLHYMEPHNPYDPPQADVDRVLQGRPQPDREAVNRRMGIPNFGTFSDEMVSQIRTFYDAEVMSLDAELRKLFATLKEKHDLDHAIVVLLADHGEEFLEHGIVGHHQSLFEEVLRVPLIVLVPGHDEGAAIEPIVSVTDVAPTVLDLAGIPAPAAFEGGSLRALMGLPRHGWWPFGSAATEKETSHAALPPTGVAFSELIKNGEQRQRPHERTVITPSSKLIADVGGGREFYDLVKDPGETNPDALSQEERSRLSAQLANFVEHVTRRTAPESKVQMDDETRERMRALGYQE
jgi:arylsulfatase A-like enzyme